MRAHSAGFCWGVERAIDIARQIAADKSKAEPKPVAQKTYVYTDGPLIHNQQMTAVLEAEGIHEIGDYQSKTALEIDDKAKQESVLVVRAHGISPQRREYLKSLGIPFKDATCPDVGIIAGKIRMHAKKGSHTVIFGDPKHPEVIGLMGYAEGRGHVIQTAPDIDALPEMEGTICMVSQSTMFVHEFQMLSKHLLERFPEALVFDTICSATKERQSDVITLKQKGAQAIVVIGGKHSANTVKLASLSRLQNIPTFHIETSAELDFAALEGFETIGVTAGASTPKFIIDDVCEKLDCF